MCRINTMSKDDIPLAGAAGEPPDPVSFREALVFWLKLGFISFGGPAGQISMMHQELVERRRWISERRFLHALNYCMLLPGPEAQQLATYIGWLMHRSAGGIVAGALFVLPSLLILIVLSWIYMAFGESTLVAGLFYGIKPAVTAIVAQAACMARRSKPLVGQSSTTTCPCQITRAFAGRACCGSWRQECCCG